MQYRNPLPDIHVLHCEHTCINQGWEKYPPRVKNVCICMVMFLSGVSYPDSWSMHIFCCRNLSVPRVQEATERISLFVHRRAKPQITMYVGVSVR